MLGLHPHIIACATSLFQYEILKRIKNGSKTYQGVRQHELDGAGAKHAHRSEGNPRCMWLYISRADRPR